MAPTNYRPDILEARSGENFSICNTVGPLDAENPSLTVGWIVDVCQTGVWSRGIRNLNRRSSTQGARGLVRSYAVFSSTDFESNLFIDTNNVISGLCLNEV